MQIAKIEKRKPYNKLLLGRREGRTELTEKKTTSEIRVRKIESCSLQDAHSQAGNSESD